MVIGVKVDGHSVGLWVVGTKPLVGLFFIVKLLHITTQGGDLIGLGRQRAQPIENLDVVKGAVMDVIELDVDVSFELDPDPVLRLY